MKEDDWDEVMSINLKGCFIGIKSVTRPMIKNKAGRIINITSVIGQIGNAGQSNYAASKAGIMGLTKSMAKELGSRNITVNAVAPGYITTDMTDELNDDVKEKMKSSIPLGRLGTPDDVANLVCFLASDDAGYITGQTFNVDGGMVMI
jgi:3-oxoacyl-[acyl-carrier protein] reductase